MFSIRLVVRAVRHHVPELQTSESACGTGSVTHLNARVRNGNATGMATVANWLWSEHVLH